MVGLAACWYQTLALSGKRKLVLPVSDNPLVAQSRADH